MTMTWQMAIDNMIAENLSALSKPRSLSLFSVPWVYMSLVSPSPFEGVYLFCNLFLVAPGLHCCAWAFSSCGKRGLVFTAVHALLIVVASLVAEHRLCFRGLQQL